MGDILHVQPTERTKEWLEKVDQIAGLNFRCPTCRSPLTVAVCQILFADKEELQTKSEKEEGYDD